MLERCRSSLDSVDAFKSNKCERLPVEPAIQSQCFASISQCAGAQIWPIRRQLRRAAQSCRSPCPQEGALRQWQGNRHHCLPVFDGLYLQSVGKAEYRHAKVIGFGSLSHRAGGAVASSVTMRPRESLRFCHRGTSSLFPSSCGRLCQSAAKAAYRPCRVTPKESMCFAR